MPTGGLGGGGGAGGWRGINAMGIGSVNWDNLINQQQQWISVSNGTWATADDGRHNKQVLTAMKEVKDSAVEAAPMKEGKATEHGTLLKELGFKKLHSKVSELAETATKINLATLAGFKKIPFIKFQEADTRLRSSTAHSKVLALTPVGEYVGQHGNENDISLPPTEVLNKMADAKKAEVFDDFAVIHVVRGPDPILVGTIKGTKDMFFIAEWGDDIKLADII